MTGTNTKCRALASETAEARRLDQEIRSAINTAQRSLIEVGALLARMKERSLWEHLPGGYRRWDDYVRDVIGPMSRSTVYEMLAAHALTLGTNPVPAATVNRIGVKKAAELARLEPHERTPELIEAAVTEPLPSVKKRVQDRINENLPLDQRKEVKIKFVRSFTLPVIREYENFMKIAVNMEGIRDGDFTLTREEKVLLALISHFRANFTVELEEAAQYLETKAAEAENDIDQCQVEGTAIFFYN